VSASVVVTGPGSHAKAPGNSEVVVWLSPLTPPGKTATPPPSSPHKAVLLQKNKTFEPHVLVIPVGTEVEFPNKDPFFHNVFSMFEGKRFDLRLYESGSSRSQRFDRPGISYVFCNIHSEMSAVIIALDTPYYATSNRAGEITVPNVPAGRYMLHVWKEGLSNEALRRLSVPVVVSSSSTQLGKLVVQTTAPLPLTHKNKYGRDYDQPTPGQIYNEPQM
jgi:plastocyanin